MKKYICISFVSVLLLSLILPVSAQTLSSPSEEYIDYLENETDYISRKVQYVMNEFIASDNPSEILSHLIADDESIPEYEISLQEDIDEEYYDLFGMSGYRSENYVSETLYANGITIQTLSNESQWDGEMSLYVTNTVVIEREAFDILSDEVRFFINSYINLEECYIYIQESRINFKNIWDENSHQWFSVSYIGKEPNWSSKYGFILSMSDVISGSCVICNYSNEKELLFITQYIPQFARVRFGEDYNNYAHDYTVKLKYGEPDEGTDPDKTRNYKLDSITFYAKDVGNFYSEAYEQSPQTGSSAALLTFLAVVSLGVICCVRKVRV
ncbi:MAG: hypothetical protein LUI61_08535 [Firmicutes bacterium]|nr:hypothetical protein [Bacillota bacterium]